jgi:hypothetical protein
MGETMTEHVKEWWEGDGRGEHLVDVALPHEDLETVDDDFDPDFTPGVSAKVAAALCVLVCLGAVISVIVAFVLDVL